MYCNWRIQSDAESSVKIKFLHFEIEYSERCDYDSLEISEEQNFQRNTNYGKYCGNRVSFLYQNNDFENLRQMPASCVYPFQKPPVIVSYSDTILIRFQTDESTSLKGFAASFMAVEPPDDDNSDDFISATPFPGYMKSMYYSSGSQSYEDDDESSYRDIKGSTAYKTISQRLRLRLN